MANGQPLNSRDAAILTVGDILSQLVRNQVRRRQTDQASRVLDTYRGAQQDTASGVMSDPAFLRGVEARSMANPESALAQIDTEEMGTIDPGLLGKLRGEEPIDLKYLDQYGEAEKAITSIFPGEDPMSQRLRIEFGNKVQDIRDRAELQTVAAPVASALGITPEQVNPTALSTILSIMRATPRATTTFSFETTKGGKGKYVTFRRNKRTGEIEEVPSNVDVPPTGTFIDLDPETGKLSSISLGGGKPTYSPRARKMEEGKAQATLNAQNQKRFATQIFGGLERMTQLNDDDLIGGKGGAANRAVQSAANQVVSLLKKSGIAVPDQSIDMFPEELQQAAQADTRAASVAYNVAVALARFNNPQSGDVAAREVERELEYTAGAFLSGDPAQRRAGIEELARSIRRNFELGTSDVEGVKPFSDEELIKSFPGLFKAGEPVQLPPEAQSLDDLSNTIPPGMVLEYDPTTGGFKQVGGGGNAP